MLSGCCKHGVDYYDICEQCSIEKSNRRKRKKVSKVQDELGETLFKNDRWRVCSIPRTIGGSMVIFQDIKKNKVILRIPAVILKSICGKIEEEQNG